MSPKTDVTTCRAMAALLLVFLCTHALGKTIYVDDDATGLNNGSSWVNGYNHLQDALAVSISGDEVRVAQGIYKPDLGGGNTPGDREATFQLINSVTIKGGYHGFGAPDPDAQDVDVYEAILSGDLNGDDVEVSDPRDLLSEPTRSENSYHVVTSSGTDETAILEGFTITGGNDDLCEFRHSFFTITRPMGYGGGVYNSLGSPTLVSCRFASNSASFKGGGMYCDAGDPNLTNCTFAGNSAGTHTFGSLPGEGGGMYSCSANAKLTDCRFSGNSTDGYGGGMSNLESMHTLRRCTFNGNSAFWGGGVHNDRSSPALTDCTFSENSATLGGGMYNYYCSAPNLTNCNFISNSASSGGGMSNHGQPYLGSSPKLTNCLFSRNSADYQGGGMCNSGYSSSTLTSCTFTANNASDGGGMYSGIGNPTLTNCTFVKNTSSKGGGIHSYDGTLTNCTFSKNKASEGAGMYGSGTLVNCTFNGNSAGRRGGGIYVSGDLTLTNCTFSGNNAPGYEWGQWGLPGRGGGIFSGGRRRVTVTNCTFSGNSAPNGNALACDSDQHMYPSNIKITNCILWDGDNGVWNNDGSTIAINYSNVQAGSSGKGNVEGDPRLARNPNDGGDGWSDDPATPNIDEGVNDDFGDLRLMAGSPCIDAGDNEADTDSVTSTRLRLVYVDLDANLRFADDPHTPDTGNGTSPIVDMGAYEFRSPHVPAQILVDASATGVNNGTTRADAFTDLQIALRTAAAAAGAVSEIRVAAGHYAPDPNGLDHPRTATFQLVNGVSVYGGFPAGGGNWEDRDPNDHTSILTGDLNRDDVEITDAGKLRFEYTMELQREQSRSDNCCHVVTGSGNDRRAVLDGFTVTAGHAYHAYYILGYYPVNMGAGIYNYHGSPTLVNCTFAENYADNGGGMCNNVASSPTLDNCRFAGNKAARGGGGMYSRRYSNPILTNCIFSENSAGSGAGMDNYVGCNPTLTDCIFSENSAGSGAGMDNDVGCNPTLTDCVFSENSAIYGGGMSSRNSSPTLTNCTFSGNSGSGMENSGGSPTLTNCTFSGNSGSGMENYGSSPTLTNCTFSGNSAGLGAGMVNREQGSPILTNCTFNGNSAEYKGGGMFNTNNSNPTLTNCTFSENSAERDGGGMYNFGSNPTLTNCTFAQNSAENGNALGCDSYGYFPDQKYPSNVELINCILWDGGSEIWNNDNSTIMITHSNVHSSIPGEGNIDADPLFADPNNGDYHLKSLAGRWDPNSQSWVIDDVTSPCIDVGDPGTPVGLEPLPNGGIINMGAYGGTAEASKSPEN